MTVVVTAFKTDSHIEFGTLFHICIRVKKTAAIKPNKTFSSNKLKVHSLLSAQRFAGGRKVDRGLCPP